MSELWIAIGIVGIAFIFSLIALSFHRRLGAESSPETLKNTVEVMKLCGLFVVAAVSFYFIDFQKQRAEREKFDFEIYKTFAAQGVAEKAEQKLGVSATMREYRRLYVKLDSQLDKFLIALDATILKDPEVRALLSLKENQPILTGITTDRNTTIANAGEEIRKAPYQALIEQLFSPEARFRGRAYEEIIRQFRNEPAIIDDLIRFAQANMDNENGVYNTVVTLKHLSREITQPKKVEINAFCDDAQQIGDRTKQRCDVLRTWLETQTQRR